MCFWKKNLKKKFETKKKTIQFSILESTSGGTGSHSESKSLPFNCYILLLILVAITWFERIDLSSIASESFLTQKKVSHHWSPTFLFLFWLLLYCFMFSIIILYVLFMTAFYIHHTLLLVFYFNKNHHHPLEVKWKHLWRHAGFHFFKKINQGS